MDAERIVHRRPLVSETISLADRRLRAGTHVRTDVIPDENHAHHLATAVTRDWSTSTKQ
jgi:hypothetical protein